MVAVAINCTQLTSNVKRQPLTGFDPQSHIETYYAHQWSQYKQFMHNKSSIENSLHNIMVPCQDSFDTEKQVFDKRDF